MSLGSLVSFHFPPRQEVENNQPVSGKFCFVAHLLCFYRPHDTCAKSQLACNGFLFFFCLILIVNRPLIILLCVSAVWS